MNLVDAMEWSGPISAISELNNDNDMLFSICSHAPLHHDVALAGNLECEQRHSVVLTKDMPKTNKQIDRSIGFFGMANVERTWASNCCTKCRLHAIDLENKCWAWNGWGRIEFMRDLSRLKRDLKFCCADDAKARPAERRWFWVIGILSSKFN